MIPIRKQTAGVKTFDFYRCHLNRIGKRRCHVRSYTRICERKRKIFRHIIGKRDNEFRTIAACQYRFCQQYYDLARRFKLVNEVAGIRMVEITCREACQRPP